MNNKKALSECVGTIEEPIKFFKDGGIFDEHTKMNVEISEIFNDIRKELYSACSKYPKFNSTHEGYAVLKEEVDELWDGVKSNKGMMGNEYLREEAIQVAAMAIRFIRDLC